jgi:hypothetical protein
MGIFGEAGRFTGLIGRNSLFLLIILKIFGKVL